MNKKQIVYGLLEALLPAFVGGAILAMVPYQIDVFHSFLGEGSELPKLFPRLTAWGMIVISLVQVITLAVKRRWEIRNGKEIVQPRVLLGVGVLFGYALLLPTAGFFIATMLCVIGVIYLFERVSWIKAILFAAVVAFVTWYAFDQLLHIPLPAGWWE